MKPQAVGFLPVRRYLSIDCSFLSYGILDHSQCPQLKSQNYMTKEQYNLPNKQENAKNITTIFSLSRHQLLV